jgi:protein-S-isoprenylcysteine O-methyltransferase Ste14
MNIKFLEAKIPPPVIFIISSLIMYILNTYYSIKKILIYPWNLLGIIFILNGILIIFTSIFQLKKAKTTISPTELDLTSKLVTSGIFQYTRNPIYLGSLVILFGFAFILGNLSPWIMPFVFYTYITIFQIKPEEKFLYSKFGDLYSEYKKKVPRWDITIFQIIKIYKIKKDK